MVSQLFKLLINQAQLLNSLFSQLVIKLVRQLNTYIVSQLVSYSLLVTLSLPNKSKRQRRALKQKTYRYLIITYVPFLHTGLFRNRLLTAPFLQKMYLSKAHPKIKPTKVGNFKFLLISCSIKKWVAQLYLCGIVQEYVQKAV